MSFREKCLSVRLDPSATPTRTKRNYYDSGPVHAVFGEDASERLMEETEGRGVVKRDSKGDLWARDRSGDPRRVEADAGFWLGKDLETHG
jgi:hypothetical protein